MKRLLLVLVLGLLMAGCEKHAQPDVNANKKAAESGALVFAGGMAPSGKVYVATADELEKLMPKDLCSRDQKALLKNGEDCMSNARQQAWLETHHQGKK